MTIMEEFGEIQDMSDDLGKLLGSEEKEKTVKVLTPDDRVLYMTESEFANKCAVGLSLRRA